MNAAIFLSLHQRKEFKAIYLLSMLLQWTTVFVFAGTIKKPIFQIFVVRKRVGTSVAELYVAPSPLVIPGKRYSFSGEKSNIYANSHGILSTLPDEQLERKINF
jgi:hypothetical protein